jgi:hypothetical protein
MSNNYGFTDTNAALQLLLAKLTALQWQPPAPGAPQPAFSKVALFDLSDLVVALRELMSFENRICLVVHDLEQFVNRREGQELHTCQHRAVTLVMSDRYVGNRQTALSGDGAAGTTPGVMALKDLVLASIVGLLQPGMYVQPEHGDQMLFQQKVRDELQGRVAFTLGLTLIGGNVITPLGRQPIPS